MADPLTPNTRRERILTLPLEFRRKWTCSQCGKENDTPDHPEFRCQNTAKCNLPMRRVCAAVEKRGEKRGEKSTIRGRKVVCLVGMRGVHKNGSLQRSYESLKAQFDKTTDAIVENARIACAVAVPNADKNDWPASQHEELGDKLRKPGLIKELLSKFGYAAGARAYRHRRYADIPNEFDICSLPIDVRNFLYLHAVLAPRLTATSRRCAAVA